MPWPPAAGSVFFRHVGGLHGRHVGKLGQDGDQLADGSPAMEVHGQLDHPVPSARRRLGDGVVDDEAPVGGGAVSAPPGFTRTD